MKLYISCFYLLYLLLKPSTRVNQGYVVAWNNDTTVVQVILPKYSLGIASYDINTKVEIIDSTHTTRTYFAKDIKAFGFLENSKMIVYRLKPVQHGSDLFLEGTVIGDHANLFEYEKQGSDKIYFTLEKTNGIYIFFDSDENSQIIKDQLKTYLHERPEIVELIDGKFLKSKFIQADLREIVKSFNQ